MDMTNYGDTNQLQEEEWVTPLVNIYNDKSKVSNAAAVNTLLVKNSDLQRSKEESSLEATWRQLLYVSISFVD
jgi:hypothetical protein